MQRAHLRLQLHLRRQELHDVKPVIEELNVLLERVVA
jgi:hypothetical protein